MEQAKYVVFDGMDGSGKGTQLALLQEAFKKNVVFTREPGGTPFAEEIRKLVRDDPRSGESTPLNNFCLFWAAREELQHNLVAPSLAAGKHVFSDRGDTATFALQLYGEGQQDLTEIFLALRRKVFSSEGRRVPDLYIVFDLPAATARDRVMHDTSRSKNYLDDRDLAYYERVRHGFEEFSRAVQPVQFIDATGTPEEIHEQVMETLSAHGVTP